MHSAFHWRELPSMSAQVGQAQDELPQRLTYMSSDILRDVLQAVSRVPTPIASFRLFTLRRVLSPPPRHHILIYLQIQLLRL